jgi:hypothetical protein
MVVMSDHTRILRPDIHIPDDIKDFPEEKSRELFEAAINEVIMVNNVDGEQADMLRMVAWAAYARLDMKALGYRLKRGEVTIDEAMQTCMPVVAEMIMAGMHASKRLH